ncbi:DEAD/DEAH box helicase [Amnibacterium soli]
MPARPRDNRTPDGEKRRWSPDERAARSASASSARGGARAGRRDPRGGAEEERGSQRPNRGIDWYPGPRINKRDERAGGGRGDGPRGDRFERGDRPDRPQRNAGDRGFRDDRPQRNAGDRGFRDDRPQRSDRAPRDDRFSRGDRPERGARFDRDDRAPRQDRFPRDDRPQRSDRPERGDRFERPQRGERFERPERRSAADRPQRDDRFSRPQRDDRPQRDRDERAPRQDRFDRDARPQRDDRRPQRDRDDRAPRQDRFDRDSRPQRDDRRPQRDERRSFRDEQPRGARPERRSSGTDEPRRGRFEQRPDRASSADRPFRGREPQRSGRDERAPRFTAPQDEVLERLEGDVVTAEDVAGRTFADLGLGEQITKALAELGAKEPFPIQAATIPAALRGRNVLGRGRTGSGKTIAFGAALVERLLRNWAESGRTGSGRRVGRPPRALILAPTRELALQIDRTVQPIARAVGLYTTQIFGGVPQARQVGALAKGVDIVIGTPGRMEDLVEQGRLDLSAVEISVLDEADHMADLGFVEPIQRLLRRVPEVGQRLLFSATLDAAVSQLVQEFLPDPDVHEVAEAEGATTADHRVLVIEQGEKVPVLTALLASSERSLVFARTRSFAEELADALDAEGIRTESLHGDLNQARRTRNLGRFSEGKVAALVATDVAARGIHVDDVELVVQADSAEDYKTYLHRSGRTGRAGATGTVVTLITARRRRGFTELLERAGIDAEFVVLRKGDDPVAAIGR